MARTKKDSGVPGGGAGRKEEARSNVYPISGPLPPGDAKVIPAGKLGNPGRDSGYQDHGGSELSMDPAGVVTGGLTAGPGGEPEAEDASIKTKARKQAIERTSKERQKQLRKRRSRRVA